MPHAEGKTTQIQGSLYAATSGFVAKPNDGWTFANATTIRGAQDANLIKKVRSIGAMGKDANLIEFTVYDEDTQEQASGPATRPSFEFTFVQDYSDAKRLALTNLNVGDKVQLVYKVETADEKISVRILTGTISANRTNPAEGEVETQTVGVAISDLSPVIPQA